MGVGVVRRRVLISACGAVLSLGAVVTTHATTASAEGDPTTTTTTTTLWVPECFGVTHPPTDVTFCPSRHVDR